MFEALLDSAAAAATLETSKSGEATPLPKPSSTPLPKPSSKPLPKPSPPRWLGAPTLDRPAPNPITLTLTLTRRALILVRVVRDLAHCGRHGQGLPRAQGAGAGHP